MVSLVICVVVFQIGLFQAQELYREWPNSQPMVQSLLTQLQPGKSRILTEESEVPLYYLQDKVASSQLTSLNWFEYTDKAGHYATGEEAYKAALSEGYFDVVELHFGANTILANALKDSLNENSLYGPKPVAVLPYTNRFGSGFFYIWRKR